MKGGPPWWSLAACAGSDPDLFYPPHGAASPEAMRICRACPVRTECLIHCLLHGETYGIWGGTTEAERRKICRAVTKCP
ncbi:WhiB family transcriptional regulator [Nonomuraea recticatena]|uniref:Transcriptional regulator WhiB n=1 Tax=Nonomuraea recticatena TaxID=46178 RepID=A0ABP6E047_9ACTN